MNTPNAGYIQPPDDDDSVYQAIRASIEGDDEKLADAVSDYYDPMRVEMDGHDLLTEFTLALAKSEPWLRAVCEDRPIPDSELQNFRALLRQVETAEHRLEQAIVSASEGMLP